MTNYLEEVIQLLTGQEVHLPPLKSQKVTNLNDALNNLDSEDIKILRVASSEFKKTELKGCYTDAEEPSTEENTSSTPKKFKRRHYNPLDESDYLEIIDKIFPSPETTGRTGTTENTESKKRISFILPTKMSKPDSRSNQWTHYHLKPSKNQGKGLINDPNQGYGTRLFTALHLLGLAKANNRSKESTFLLSLIKSFDLAHFFDVFSKEDHDTLNAHLERIEGIEGIEGIEETQRLQGYIHNLENNNSSKGYYVFIRNSESTSDKYCLPNLVNLKTSKHNDYSTFRLPNDNISRPNQAEEIRQRILIGIGYTLAMFSGTIVTLEFKASPQATTTNNNTPHFAEFNNPVLVAPKELTAMLLDLEKYSYRLDNYLIRAETKIDLRKSPQKEKISTPPTLASLYSLATLLTITPFDEKLTKQLEAKYDQKITGEIIPTSFPTPLLYAPSTEKETKTINSIEDIKGVTQIK